MSIPTYEIAELKPGLRGKYAKWDDFLLHRVKFNRPESDIHSIGHCERVLLFALLVGDMTLGYDHNDLEILAQAAVFHDTRREDDSFDTGHGARAALYYKQFCKKNPDITFHPEVVYLVRYHDLDDAVGVKAIRRAFGNEADHVILLYEIFKDADALDRWRLGSLGLDPSFLRTKAARELIDYARRIVEETIPAEQLRKTDEEVRRIINKQKD